MKKIAILTAFVLLLPCGCRDLVTVNAERLPFYSHRHEKPCAGGEDIPPDGGEDLEEDSGPLPFTQGDSVICVGVIYQGPSGRSIRIYRNWKLAREIPVSEKGFMRADADRLHLIGEHLYSEFHDMSGNVVCLDGERLLTIGGNENLRGICSTEGSLFLLSDMGPGAGFVFRKNGSIVQRRDSGSILGDLPEPSYAPGGALYSDRGQCRFSWLENAASGIVLGDGPEIPLDAGDYILDMRLHNGILHKTLKKFDADTWSRARLWFRNGRPIIVGETCEEESGEIFSTCCEKIDDSVGTGYSRIPVKDALLYYNGRQGMLAVTWDRDGTVSICGTSGKAAVPGTYAEPRAQCCRICDDGMVMCLNPSDGESHPVLYFRERTWELKKLDGTVFALSIEASPPS